MNTVDETACWLGLNRCGGIRLRDVEHLLGGVGTLSTLIYRATHDSSPAKLSREVCDRLASLDGAAIEADLSWVEQPGHYLLTAFDERYPRRLLEIPDPPLVLFANGNPALLVETQLAIVGSRNPTSGGRETAFAFARELASLGLVITSGLAAGIDTESHRGALQAGGGTVAVLGAGPDRIYPRENWRLFEEIAANGLVITEFPTGSEPHRRHFPRRHRIISGLCLGVLVVEAARNSGSLITARCAVEQGREVFAIPGSIHNPMSKGCHALIRQGAKLVEAVDDIAEELIGQLELTAPMPAESLQPSRQTVAPEERDADYRHLLECLGYDPVPVDRLVERTGLTPEVVSSMLLALELQGEVRAAPGSVYTRVSKRD